MRNLFTKILHYVLPILAGIGVVFIADKKLAGKAPGYDAPVLPELTPKKVAWVVAIFAVGHIIYHFIVRKLNLKTLR